MEKEKLPKLNVIIEEMKKTIEQDVASGHIKTEEEIFVGQIKSLMNTNQTEAEIFAGYTKGLMETNKKVICGSASKTGRKFPFGKYCNDLQKVKNNNGK